MTSSAKLQGITPADGDRPRRRLRALVATEFRERYELGPRLGQGAFCAVYEARQLAVGRIVAVKVLSADDPDDRARFLQEGRMLADLRHPNVLQVFSLEDLDGHPALVMEHMCGGSLRAMLDRAGRLPVTEALRIVLGCLSGLQALHEAGLVHRDLKPANILFDAAGQPKIADLGMARTMNGPGMSTGDGQVVGTPQYMSPEQIRGRPATPASDVYAMALILHELLSGTPAFSGTSARSLFLQQLQEPPAVLHHGDDRIPARLAQVIQRALAKEPEQRPSSAAELANALAPFATGAPSSSRLARTLTRSRPVPAPVRHEAASPAPGPERLAVVAVVGGFAFAALSFIGWGAWQLAAAWRPVPAAARPVAGQPEENPTLPQAESMVMTLARVVPEVGVIVNRVIAVARAARPPGSTAIPATLAPQLRAEVEAWCRQKLGITPAALRTDAARWLADGRLSMDLRARLHELLTELSVVDAAFEVAVSAEQLPVPEVRSEDLPLALGDACAQLMPVRRDPPGALAGYRPIPDLSPVRERNLLARTHLALMDVIDRPVALVVLGDMEPRNEMMLAVARELQQPEPPARRGLSRWYHVGDVPAWLPLERGGRIGFSVANLAPGSLVWLRIGGRRIGVRTTAVQWRASLSFLDMPARDVIESQAARVEIEIPPALVEPGARRVLVSFQALPTRGGAPQDPGQIVHWIADLVLAPR